MNTEERKKEDDVILLNKESSEDCPLDLIAPKKKGHATYYESIRIICILAERRTHPPANLNISHVRMRYVLVIKN